MYVKQHKKTSIENISQFSHSSFEQNVPKFNKTHAKWIITYIG